MLTDEELKQIEERCEKATPGPWRVENDSDYDEYTDTLSEWPWQIQALDGRTICDIGDDGHNNDVPDFDFIAHSRTDIPALIAEVRRLEAENNKLQDIIQGMGIELTELRVNKICMDEHERIYEALGCKYEGEALAKIQALKTHFCEIGPDQYFDGKS